MSDSKFQSNQMVNQAALPVLRQPIRTELSTTIPLIDTELGGPVRLFASNPSDALLNIASNRVPSADGTTRTTPPINEEAIFFASTTVNFQTGAVSPSGNVLLNGAAFALPASVTGEFKRVAFVLRSDGKIDTNFSANAASYAALPDPGSLFSALDGLPVGWIDVVGTTTANPGSYKSASSAGVSATNIIENAVSGQSAIFKFAAGGGAGGGASGAGEINLIKNSSAQFGLSNWGTSGAGVTLALTNLASELSLFPVLAKGFKITGVSGTAYARVRFAMAEGLKQKKLKIEWYQRRLGSYADGDFKIELYKNSLSDYTGSFTKFNLSTDLAGDSPIPAINGKFTTTFDTDDANYYELRFVRVAGTSSLGLQNVIVGPGIQPQGAAVGPIVEWTPTTTWSVASAWTGNWRRVGNYVKYEAYSEFTGGTNAGVLQINLPPGHEVSPLWKGGFGGDSIPFALGSVYDGGINTHSIFATMISNTLLQGYYSSTAASKLANVDSTGSPITIGAGSVVRLEWELPIAAFDGSGTVNFAENDLEYAASTDLTDTDNTGAASERSTKGSRFPSITTARFKEVYFTSSYQQGDEYNFEYSADGGVTWDGLESGRDIDIYHVQNGVSYGISYLITGPTSIRVQFGQYRRSSGATFGAAGSPWSDLSSDSSYFYRVKKSKAGAAVGFGLAKSNASGLVSRETATVEQDIAGPFTWTGTAPTINTAKCMYHQVGKTVTANMLMGLSPSGVNNTQVSFPFPSYLPAPKQFTTSVDLTWISIGDGSLLATPDSPIEGGGCGILRNTGGGLLFVIYSKDGATVNAATANATITYICE